MMVRIVTDMLFFCFVFFLLTSGLSLYFSLPLSFPSPSSTLSGFYVLLSQLEVLHYRLSVSSALHGPAQPSLQALHAYQVLAALRLFHFTPAPWCKPQSACQCSGKAGGRWGCSETPFHTEQGPGGCGAAWPFSPAPPPAVRTSRGLRVWPCGMECAHDPGWLWGHHICLATPQASRGVTISRVLQGLRAWPWFKGVKYCCLCSGPTHPTV